MVFDRLLSLHRQAVLASAVALGRCDDPAAPTPCNGWRLADLLAHMTVQHLGFARAARGEQTTVNDWRPQPLQATVARYVEACADVLGSFAAVRDPAAPVVLPEIRDEPVPVHVAIGFHLLDYVVHAWDVAVSVGGRVELGEDVLAAALTVARNVPTGAAREKPDAAFAPVLPVPAGASTLDEILLLTGRDPDWRAA
jgi:uncharacterized protein (TIGR03086 family)